MWCTDSLLAEKRDIAYSTTLHWLRCRLNFSLFSGSALCHIHRGTHTTLRWKAKNLTEPSTRPAQKVGSQTSNLCSRIQVFYISFHLNFVIENNNNNNKQTINKNYCTMFISYIKKGRARCTSIAAGRGLMMSKWELSTHP